MKREGNKMEDVHIRYEGDFFLTGLALLFIALKLCGVIHWSWLWVLSPLWIPFGLIIIFTLVILVCKIIKKGVDKTKVV